jgi:hypothetical protein
MTTPKEVACDIENDVLKTGGGKLIPQSTC